MHIKRLLSINICFCLLIVLSISCKHNYNNKTLNALKLAGSNKKELKKVLKHYKKDPADSSKYKAACFIIENMQWHWGQNVKPSPRLWDLFVLEDSLVISYFRDSENYKNKDAFNGYKYRLKKMFVKDAICQSTVEDKYVSDLQNIKAESIIKNIDLAFSVRNNWLNEMPDSIFFEYVLPNRTNMEPVYPIREKLHKHFLSIEEIRKTNKDIVTAIDFLNKYIKLFNWDWDEENIPLPDLGFYNIFYWHNKNLTCKQQVAFFTKILRSIGIPAKEVYTPKWRNSNIGHSWGVIPDSINKHTLFSPIYQKLGDVYLPHSPASATKLYMRTYAAQPSSPWFLKANEEELPIGFETPCIKDVTREFISVGDIKLNLKIKADNNNLCWFCLFTQGKWAPIGWGVIDKTSNSVSFKNIPTGLTGLACTLKNGELSPVSDLITINPDGFQIIKPDKNTKENMFLTRKFPEKTRLQYFTKDIIGTKIQGANQSDFSDSVTLHTIIDTLQPYFQDVCFDNSKKYRYYRIYAPTWNLHIAEVEFLSNIHEKGTIKASSLPLFKDPISKPKLFYKFNGKIIASRPDSTAFDGNMLTYSIEKWVGIDLGKPYKLNRIRIAPRNAHNGIVAGDRYQLYYWDNNWIPTGINQAKYNFVKFENIPTNTLYWLRNLDHGKEEQPFFYKNEVQIFSNQPDLRECNLR